MRRRISQPRLVLLATLAFALAAAPAGAAGWVPATPPSNAANGPSGAVVALDPAGDALAAWTEDDGAGTQTLLVAWRPAGGPWGAPQPLASDVVVDAPAVTLDAAGNGTVVWIDSGDGATFAVHAARRDAAGGAWSAPHDFPADGAVEGRTQVRADAAGDAIAAWLEQDGSAVPFVRAAVWSGGGWSTPTRLSNPSDTWVVDAGAPQIAPDASGGPLVAWTAQVVANPADYAVQTAAWSGGAWQPPRDLVATSGAAISPVRLVGVAGGGAAASWTQDDGSTTLWGALRATGNWNVDQLSDDVVTVGCEPLQALGADDGGATVVWRTASGGTLEAKRLLPGGPEADGTAFAPSGESVQEATIDRGTVVLVAHDPVSNADSVLATRRSGGGWSPPALLQTGDPGALLAGPVLASDAAGDQLASWTATGALGGKSVAAAALQASAPQLTDVSVPASGTAGSALSTSASARSTFATIAQTSWDFGDGSAALAGASASHVYAQAGTYTVTVTVTDAVGNATQASRQVTVAAAPGGPRSPPPPGDRGTLLHPVVGGARGGVLVLARGARTLRLTVRNPNGRTLRGLALLTRPRSGSRPALTLASRRGLAFAPHRRTTLTLTLTDRALRALQRAPGHRLRVTLTLRLRAPDGRRVTVRPAFTLDAAPHFAVRAPTPTARTAC